MRVGAILILAGLMIMMVGVAVRAQFVPEQPYLVSEPHLTQAQVYINAFENVGVENENTIWKYNGSFGLSFAFYENENTGRLMILNGENILTQENGVWIWNPTPSAIVASGDVRSITKLGYRSWEIVLSPITVNNIKYDNGVIVVKLTYGRDAFKFDFEMYSDDYFRLGTDLMYLRAENILIYFGKDNVHADVTKFKFTDLSVVGEKLYYNFDISVKLKEVPLKTDIYAVVVGFETKEPWWVERKHDISTILLLTGAVTMIAGVFVASQERKAIRWR